MLFPFMAFGAKRPKRRLFGPARRSPEITGGPSPRVQRWVFLVATALLAAAGTTLVAVGAVGFGKAMVELDPGDPANYESAQAAADPDEQAALREQRAQAATTGVIFVVTGVAVAASAAFVAALTPPVAHTHREKAK